MGHPPTPASLPSNQNLQPILLHHGEQLAGHAAGALGTGFPLLDRGLAGVQIARKHRLAHIVGLAQLAHRFGRESGRHRQARRVEIAHRRLVDRAHLLQRLGRSVDGGESVALGFHGAYHAVFIPEPPL